VALVITINTTKGQTFKNTELYFYGLVSTSSPLYGAFPRVIKLQSVKKLKSQESLMTQRVLEELLHLLLFTLRSYD
jgi:hypothetical protein